MKSVDFVTLSWNNYNHEHVKLLRIVVSYFQGYSFDILINNEILTFVEISGEAINIIAVQMMKAVANYELDTKIVR